MKALFCRTVGRPTPQDFRIATHWTTADQPQASDTLDALVKIMPTLEVGARVNTDLGAQFYYRYNASAEHDVMVFTAGFSHQMFIAGIGARQGFGLDFEQFAAQLAWRVSA